jgi:hypothetical protein
LRSAAAGRRPPEKEGLLRRVEAERDRALELDPGFGQPARAERPFAAGMGPALFDPEDRFDRLTGFGRRPMPPA